jgi:uncharacterized membrane protein
VSDTNSITTAGTGAAQPPQLDIEPEEMPTTPNKPAKKARTTTPGLSLTPRTKKLIMIALATILVMACAWWLFGAKGLIGLLFGAGFTICGVAISRRSKAKKAELSEEAVALAEERRSRPKRIVTLRNKHPRSFAVLVANDAGDGSKTTTTASLALAGRNTLKAIPIVIIEGRKDSAQGAHKHGLDRASTATIREFHNKIVNGQLQNSDGSLNNELILAAMTATESGIFFLEADVHTPKPDPFSESMDPAKLVMETVLTTGAMIFVDASNASTENVTLGMANYCHAAVFPTMTTRKSLDMWRDTVDNLKSHAISPIMSNCVTILNGVKSNRLFERSKKKLEPLPGEGYFFSTTFDPHLVDDVGKERDDDEDDENTKVIEWDKISPINRDVFEDVIEALWRMFVQHNVKS